MALHSRVRKGVMMQSSSIARNKRFPCSLFLGQLGNQEDKQAGHLGGLSPTLSGSSTRWWCSWSGAVRRLRLAGCGSILDTRAVVQVHLWRIVLSQKRMLGNYVSLTNLSCRHVFSTGLFPEKLPAQQRCTPQLRCRKFTIDMVIRTIETGIWNLLTRIVAWMCIPVTPVIRLLLGMLPCQCCSFESLGMNYPTEKITCSYWNWKPNIWRNATVDK